MGGWIIKLHIYSRSLSEKIPKLFRQINMLRIKKATDSTLSKTIFNREKNRPYASDVKTKIEDLQNFEQVFLFNELSR